MSIKRIIIKALDRPGGRGLLALGASAYAKKLTENNVKIFFDETWLHYIDGFYFPDGQKFRYYEDTVLNWKAYLGKCFKNTEDHWFYTYKPKKGDIIVDIGAGVGEDLFVLTDAVGDSGCIIAVEAHPTTFLDMKKLCQWNRYANVKLFQNAITDKPSTLYIDDVDEHETNSVLMQGNDNKRFPVAGVTLDSICSNENISHIDFLKMNIEGAEKYAIHGMEKVIKNTKHVCISCHDFRADRGDGEEFRSREIILEFLRDNGFEIFWRNDDPRDYVRDQLNGVNKKL